MMRLLLAALALLAPAALRAQDPPGLEDLFVPGGLLEDRNGDGFVDFVNARLELGDAPSADVAAAAAEVAARLGFETMAMDLPLTGRADGVVVRFAVGATDLARGEGRVELGVDGLSLEGADASGLRAAAKMVAGRLPHLWDVEGPTFETLFADAAAALGVETVEARVASLRVRDDGVTRLDVAIELPTAPAPAARAALESALSYRGVREITVTLLVGATSESLRIRRTPAPPAPGPIPGRPGGGARRSLDLSSLYTPDGLLGDSDQNLIADRIDTVLSPAGSFRGTVDLAARLGLEAAGVSIPIVKLPEEIEDASEEPLLTLIGEHPLVEEDVALEPGEGYVRVVPEAFGPSPALVVRGGDASGVERALDQLAVRLPNVWEHGKDRETLDDVELELWKFFSGRSPAGQAATALYKLDRLVERLEGRELASLQALVSIESPAPGLAEIVRERLAGLGAERVDVVLDDRDVQKAATIFEESFEIPSEVEELRRLVEARLLPRVRRGRPVVVEARLSEPLSVRRALEEELEAALRDEGARDPDVRVLSAYKQGYSWLTEIVAPALEGRDVSDLTIRFAEYTPPDEWPQQAMLTPVRWLHEAFPADEILARELSLPLARVRLEMAPPDAPAYEAIARGADGSEVFRESFEPKLVLRPYVDRFRDYEMVNATTGWVTARVGEERVLDQRIATDPERFWDHFQSETLARVYDYVMERHEGNPRGDGKDAPYFGELEVELALSEPDEEVGVEREIVSSMDALHEDVYFTTLTFFRLLGRNARGEELTYPGRVIPRMRPKSDGRAGAAHIRFTGFATSRPAVVVAYAGRDGAAGELRVDVPKVEVDRPSATGARVRAGERGIARLELRQKVHMENDERDALLQIERAEDVDESILSAEQAAAMLGNLEALRDRGLYQDALAAPDLGALDVTLAWEYRNDPATERIATLAANGRPAPPPDVERYLSKRSPPAGGGIVQWRTPIPPPEAYGLLAEMARFDEATVYRAGTSYLGREIWAMDLMAPIEASHLSRYKATTLKPTVVYSARQHANEVSSTSHVLKLAENLLTDPVERKKLDAVNVVIHPITNPDGAQLAYDLYRETPDFILHAGYYASLGMDVTSDSSQPMPIYPEARVRPELWSAWLPDVFLNPHGYPSHQLVQLFSEYTGLVRRGRVTERNWSMNKGWFMPGFGYVDDPQFPRHKEAAFRIRDYITEAIRSLPEVDAMNQRNYDRYRRYGGDDDPEVFKLPMVNGVMIHTALKGDRAPSPGSDRGYNPRVTVWSGTTEAPDETAHGDWLELVATAGLAWDRAILQYLVDGEHRVERKSSSFFGGVSLSLDRPRPPEPPDREESEKP